MNKRQRRFYQKFKKAKITIEELKKAKGLAGRLGSISDKFMMMIRMIKSDIKGEFKIPMMEKVKIIGAILYVLSPLDAIIDVIPFIGFGDDIAVVTYVLTKIGGLISEYEKFEETEKLKEKDKNVDFDNLRVVNEDEGE